MLVYFLWSHKFLFLAIVTQLLIFSPFSMTLSGGKLFASLIPVFTATTINHLPTLWSSPLARDNWRWQFHGLLLGLWLVSAGHVTPILASDWLRTVVTRSRVWDATLVIIVIIIVGGGGCWFCGHTMGPINTNNQTHLGHWDTPPFSYKSRPVQKILGL